MGRKEVWEVNAGDGNICISLCLFCLQERSPYQNAASLTSELLANSQRGIWVGDSLQVAR